MFWFMTHKIPQRYPILLANIRQKGLACLQGLGWYIVIYRITWVTTITNQQINPCRGAQYDISGCAFASPSTNKRLKVRGNKVSFDMTEAPSALSIATVLSWTPYQSFTAGTGRGVYLQGSDTCLRTSEQVRGEGGGHLVR